MFNKTVKYPQLQVDEVLIELAKTKGNNPHDVGVISAAYKCAIDLYNDILKYVKKGQYTLRSADEDHEQLLRWYIYIKKYETALKQGRTTMVNQKYSSVIPLPEHWFSVDEAILEFNDLCEVVNG